MEVFSLLFGVFVIVPAALVATSLLLIARLRSKLKTKWFLTAIALIWTPICLAAWSELHWMYVEEPYRMAHGLPIE